MIYFIENQNVVDISEYQQSIQGFVVFTGSVLQYGIPTATDTIYLHHGSIFVPQSRV